MLFVTFGLLLLGLHRSFKFLRGDFKGQQELALYRSGLGGYFGGIFAAPIVAGSYYLGWYIDADYYDPVLVPFATLLGEITFACILAGIVLGPASLALSKWPFGRRAPSLLLSLVGGIAGGILAGLIVGPPLTFLFGRLDRPAVSAAVLLPGGLLGVSLLVFSIVTYNVERISYRTMRRNAVIAFFSTLFVSAVAGLMLLAVYGVMQEQINALLGHRDTKVLLTAGLAIGAVVGVILGSAISVALLFTEREEKDWPYPFRREVGRKERPSDPGRRLRRRRHHAVAPVDRRDVRSEDIGGYGCEQLSLDRLAGGLSRLAQRLPP